MKSRPILFSGSMVRALLDGSKCQTRRIVKPQPPDDCGGIEVGPYHPTIIRRGEDEPGPEVFGAYSSDGSWGVKCPHGQVGDALWVRETWAHDAESLEQCRASHEDAFGGSYGPYYRATEGAPDTLKWKPSIFMPRWASRITLQITGVRVERLQDISEADAMAEGAPSYEEGVDSPPRDTEHEWSYTASFQRLWESINGPGAWATNPFVWVLEFTTISGAKNEL